MGAKPEAECAAQKGQPLSPLASPPPTPRPPTLGQAKHEEALSVSRAGREAPSLKLR